MTTTSQMSISPAGSMHEAQYGPIKKTPWYDTLLKDMGGVQGMSALAAMLSGVAGAPTVQQGLDRATKGAVDFTTAAQYRKQQQESQGRTDQFWQQLIQMMGGQGTTAKGDPGGPDSITTTSDGTTIKLPPQPAQPQTVDQAFGAGQPGQGGVAQAFGAPAPVQATPPGQQAAAQKTSRPVAVGGTTPVSAYMRDPQLTPAYLA